MGFLWDKNKDCVYTGRVFGRLAIPSFALIVCCALAARVAAQDTVTGAFEGIVSDNQTGRAVAGAAVEIINRQTGLVIKKNTDSLGRFYQGLLPPGVYVIRVSAPGFQTKEVLQRLFVSRTGEVVPVPVSLDPASAAPTPTPALTTTEDADVRVEINTTDARRSGSFTDEQVVKLPLGSTTLVRTFDELALLLPGVAPPPQTIGNGTGPGQGPGVGSAGQFSVNGLRSRGNNFTVDGSDNNDEDIGVRRQGFMALIPQPIDSVKEYQVITLLAPAQFGRNMGGQVNAVSKSGGNETHGSVYGLFNSSQLNARNFFDTTGEDTAASLRANGQDVLVVARNAAGAVVSQRPLVVRNESGGEDSFTLGQGGLVVGGPLAPDRAFYFISAEGQILNATREASFSVPTLAQRGAFGTGETGIFRNPFTGAATSTIPASRNGSAIFNLFPFPNDPGGVYGANTFTQVLPASGRGRVLSGKLDGNFKVLERQQSVTARYNFTDDFRDIPAVGGALFSSIRSNTRTQNFSFFLNSEVSGPDSVKPVFNQVRLSYGRTRLNFEELRDQTFMIPSRQFPNVPFLLNARALLNITRPGAPGVANTGPVIFDSTPIPTFPGFSVEEELGTLGQVNIAGFSPVGVDVFNFPQRRVNNTYQMADVLTYRSGNHNYAFGTDIRRSELNSDLPRNNRPLATFNGSPRLIFENGSFRFPTNADPNPVIRPQDLAALSAASNLFFTLDTAGSGSGINLRFYQLNFFGQDEWRVRRNLSLSYGLRYEYNTPVREVNGRVEQTFASAALNSAPGLRQFIGGRTEIYESDLNNFAPRISVAYSPHFFGPGRLTSFRAGYGIFYDQILGAVVSQSRNVFPTFLTLNFGGLNASLSGPTGVTVLTFVNPARTSVRVGTRRFPLGLPGSLGQLNPNVPLAGLLSFLSGAFPSAVGATLPARRLETPMAHHFTFTFEQQLGHDLVVSAAYVGTVGRHLLRFTTPNLGPASTLVPGTFDVFQERFAVPQVFGRVRSPARPVGGLGAINQFETTARSRYDSLQLQARGRLRRSLQYQASYTLSRAVDDVSDVFDLAGAFVLPQNSLTFSGERGPANFDARHRLTYQFIYDVPPVTGYGRAMRVALDKLQVSGTGSFRTGQPFTVNSLIDVNLDGNLTDRLDNTQGLVVTGSRRQPLQLTAADTLSLLAPFGQDGRVKRNTFRAGSVLELDLSVIKRISVSAAKSFDLRLDIFNFINRANFGVPVRFLEAPGFGRAAETVTPGRRVQFALKYSF